MPTPNESCTLLDIAGVYAGGRDPNAHLARPRARVRHLANHQHFPRRPLLFVPSCPHRKTSSFQNFRKVLLRIIKNRPICTTASSIRLEDPQVANPTPKLLPITHIRHETQFVAIYPIGLPKRLVGYKGIYRQLSRGSRGNTSHNAGSWEFLEYALDPAWSALRTPRFEPRALS